MKEEHDAGLKNEEQESRECMEHILRVLRVRCTAFMKECLPLARTKDKVTVRVLWIVRYPVVAFESSDVVEAEQQVMFFSE